MIQEIKLRAGKWMVKAKTWEDDEKIYLKFGFNRTLLAEIKDMERPRWQPEDKVWSIAKTNRNRFQLAYLKGENPYAWYDRPLVEFEPERKLYRHQVHMARHALTYHGVILAAEMGTGKTLSAIETMERSEVKSWLWVAPRSALAAAQLEFRKWGAMVRPEFMTYDGLKSLIEHWPSGSKAPFGVVYDESSRIKNPTAQRSLAAYHLAESIRKDWGNQGFVVEMSGSPAPKSPADWWFQCEVACPGFLKEGTAEKFRRRLGLIIDREALTGGTYPHLVTWLDDENKCMKCGQLRGHANHDPMQIVFMETTTDFHKFEPSVNEVARLYQRMQGLTLVYFKKDCTDLPDKQYRIVRIKPNRETLNAAKMVAAAATSTIQALTLLRELSDGFQYSMEKVGTLPCPRCDGAGLRLEPVFTGVGMDDNPTAQQIWDDEELDPLAKQQRLMELGVGFEEIETECQQCGGRCEIDKEERKVLKVPCPKEDQLLSDLENHDEDGRLVIYAGFTGSIDSVIKTAERAKWAWIRVDGRGWVSSWGAKSAVEMLEAFQDKSRAIEKIAFVGQPSSAGMGLTLTESYEIIYYSNDFNGESRIQSEDRCHRPGMDLNKGCLITDYIHLPSDEKVLENLKKKRRLQDLSLGQFQEALRTQTEERVT